MVVFHYLCASEINKVLSCAKLFCFFKWYKIWRIQYGGLFMGEQLITTCRLRISALQILKYATKFIYELGDNCIFVILSILFLFLFFCYLKKMLYFIIFIFVCLFVCVLFICLFVCLLLCLFCCWSFFSLLLWSVLEKIKAMFASVTLSYLIIEFQAMHHDLL